MGQLGKPTILGNPHMDHFLPPLGNHHMDPMGFSYLSSQQSLPKVTVEVHLAPGSPPGESGAPALKPRVFGEKM